PIVLKEKESRRFATSGVSNVQVSDQQLQDLSQTVALDHFVEPAGYAHWSFDEAAGELFAVDSSASQAGASALQVQPAAKAPSAEVHARGRFNGALRFDGRVYGKATLPGISEHAPHTVSFWVRVPGDTTLSNAYAMVAWGVNNEQLGVHPFQIASNKNPGEGIVGA